MATFDGQFVFGVAVQIKHVQNADAAQIAAFFGLNGLTSSWGGSRGRTFMVQGCFVGQSIGDCLNADAFMRSYADGFGYVLTDTYDRVWYPVTFDGNIDTQEGGPVPGSAQGQYVWLWPYKLVLKGLA